MRATKTIPPIKGQKLFTYPKCIILWPIPTKVWPPLYARHFINQQLENLKATFSNIFKTEFQCLASCSIVIHHPWFIFTIMTSSVFHKMQPQEGYLLWHKALTFWPQCRIKLKPASMNLKMYNSDWKLQRGVKYTGQSPF